MRLRNMDKKERIEKIKEKLRRNQKVTSTELEELHSNEALKE